MLGSVLSVSQVLSHFIRTVGIISFYRKENWDIYLYDNSACVSGFITETS